MWLTIQKTLFRWPTCLLRSLIWKTWFLLFFLKKDENNVVTWLGSSKQKMTIKGSLVYWLVAINHRLLFMGACDKRVWEFSGFYCFFKVVVDDEPLWLHCGVSNKLLVHVMRPYVCRVRYIHPQYYHQLFPATQAVHFSKSCFPFFSFFFLACVDSFLFHLPCIYVIVQPKVSYLIIRLIADFFFGCSIVWWWYINKLRSSNSISIDQIFPPLGLFLKPCLWTFQSS